MKNKRTKKQKTQTAIKSRRKGKRFERETAIFFRRWWPDARRSFGQSRQGGDAPDVQGTPFWIECKNLKRKITKNMIIDWASKAEAESGVSSRVVIRYKQNHQPIKYALWSTHLAELEVDANYNGERPDCLIDLDYHDYFYNIPEQYISDLLDFAYGVVND